MGIVHSQTLLGFCLFSNQQMKQYHKDPSPCNHASPAPGYCHTWSKYLSLCSSLFIIPRAAATSLLGPK